MEEEKKTMVENNEKTPEVKKPVSNIDKAKEAAELLKEQNDRMERLVARQEALAVDKMLGGEAEAGQPEVEKKEISDAEYAKKVMAGEIDGKE